MARGIRSAQQSGKPGAVSSVRRSRSGAKARRLEHDPEKCEAVFGKDHAQTKRYTYSASGVGLSAGGSIPNVAAVMQVIEKLPVVATSATRLSSPMAFSA